MAHPTSHICLAFYQTDPWDGQETPLPNLWKPNELSSNLNHFILHFLSFLGVFFFMPANEGIITFKPLGLLGFWNFLADDLGSTCPQCVK